MIDREFKIADCCFNCEQRECTGRLSRSCIKCLVDGKMRNGRLICNLYKHSNNKNVLSGETQILNDNLWEGK